MQEDTNLQNSVFVPTPINANPPNRFSTVTVEKYFSIARQGFLLARSNVTPKGLVIMMLICAES